MKTDGQVFLDELANVPWSGFDARFAGIATNLRLGGTLGRSELKLLHEAAFQAMLCNIALNGLGGCGAQILPKNEGNRTKLEQGFVEHCTLLYGSSGWQSLPDVEQEAVKRVFLSVSVSDENLAW